VDHSDGQECALGGQLGCGDPGRRAQTKGVQAQPTPHEFRNQGRRNRERAGVATQHKTVARPNEVVRQGCCR